MNSNGASSQVTYSTRKEVKQWMEDNGAKFDDYAKLAKAAFSCCVLPPYTLKDKTHWIWDDALSVILSNRIGKRCV